MLLQRMMFPDICKKQELYYKSNNCEIYDRKITFLTFDSMVDFSCYFNMFSIEKWSKYTNCGSIGIQLQVTGSVNLIVKHIYTNNLGLIVEDILNQNIVNESKDIITIDFPKVKNGFYSILLRDATPNTIVENLAYISTDKDNPKQDIKLGLCICTYHRENEILNNISYIKSNIINNPDNILHDKIKIFISDNASSLDVQDSQNIHIFHNKNYGGSGGFSRAVIEALKSDVTHMVLMDDDILFELEVLERTYTFLLMLKNEFRNAFLGAAMLMSNKPSIQHAAGETDDLVGIHFDKRYLDLTNLNTILLNELEVGSNYLGWWYCAIPRKVFETKGLSYPMFVQYDDIEFSIRNIDCPKINVSGIAVWHEDFETKKSAVKTYYTIRNRLISHSLCYGKVYIFRRCLECFMKSIGRVRRGFYNEAVLILRAIDDYLKGPEYICSLDLDSFNSDLYEYVKSDNEKNGLCALLDIFYKNIRMYLKLLRNSKEIAIAYQKTLSEYTSLEYWDRKLK